MANPRHVEIVKRRSAAITAWRKRHPGERLDLSSADLSSAVLRNTNLRDAQLISANLEDANLKRANLEDTNLVNANLVNANLVNANLVNANLRGAQLQGAQLQGAQLQGAQLQGAQLKRANLEDTNLVKAQLEDANLEDAKLKRANLERANLERVNLERANLERVNLERANLERANLERANLERANLERANLERANLYRVGLNDHTQISDKWRFVWKVVNGGQLGIDLRGADLSGANLTQVDLSDLDLSGANLQGANLSQVKLSGTALDGIQVDQATLEHTKPLIPELLQAFVSRFSPEDNLSRIVRTIEFPPEYRQAGIGIMNYFAEVMRQKYPNIPATVQITQDDLTVRMTIETNDGHRETVEKALNDYGLVVSGQRQPAELLSDPVAVMGLQHKLDMAEMEVRHANQQLQLANNQLQLAHQQNQQKQDQIDQLEARMEARIDKFQLLMSEHLRHADRLADVLATHASLMPLQPLLARGLTQADEVAIKQMLTEVGQKSPGALRRLAENIAAGTIGGANGELLAEWLIAVAPRLADVLQKML